VCDVGVICIYVCEMYVCDVCENYVRERSVEV
jgi:hypothetical protein